MISSSTRLFALLGDPVRHSLSPVMQNAAFLSAGVDGVYVALRCDPTGCASLIPALARAGGGGNVTIPHKELAASVVEVPSQAVVRTGACNTFWWEAGAIHGHNTDVEGFRRAVEALVGGTVAGARVLLLGAGGGARAALLELLWQDSDEILVFNRGISRAREMVSRMGDDRARALDDLKGAHGRPFDVVVNATALGLSAADPLPVDLGRLGKVGAVLDLVYGGDETPLVREARRLGVLAADGTEMLIGQGAAAFQRWWGAEAPVEDMAQALRSRPVP
jgi:shikimate dehydrogenase